MISHMIYPMAVTTLPLLKSTTSSSESVVLSLGESTRWTASSEGTSGGVCVRFVDLDGDLTDMMRDEDVR